MTIYPIEELADKRLDPYRNLRTTNLTRHSGRFIAESKPLVRRLLESAHEVESIVVDRDYLDQAQGWIPQSATIYSVPSQSVSELIGFAFHRGYLACGIRPSSVDVETFLGRLVSSGERSWMGVMLVGVQDPENMGSIFRSCAALGISDVVVGPGCADPFARRVLRVSMGNTFKLRLIHSDDAYRTMQSFHAKGIETLATCLHRSDVELTQLRHIGPTVAILGNEAKGLPETLLDAASRRVRIDMELGTDSLNVSVAAGILLHYLRRVASSNGGETQSDGHSRQE